MSVLRFSCTMCGRCCHNHSLPLTLDESIVWLEDGGNLALFCEATLWPSDPPPENLRAAHQKKRSFPVACGSSQARVTAILVAVISGACKNLGADMKCKIYERRPLVCRIYPAEISPFIELNTAKKGCPPEAWMSDKVLLSDGKIVDQNLRALVEKSRQTDRDDALQKGLLCADLGIDVSAIADEGFVAHEPDRHVFLAALKKARTADPHARHSPQPWQLFSRMPQTLELLQSHGMDSISESSPDHPFIYLHAPRSNS